MQKSKTDIKKKSTIPSLREEDISEDIVNAATLGASAMAANEPFGSVIGAAVGAAEEGMAIMKKDKQTKDKRSKKRR